MSSVSSRFVPEGCFDVLEHTFQKYLEIKCSSIVILRGRVNDNNFWSAHIYEISNSRMVKFIAIVSTHIYSSSTSSSNESTNATWLVSSALRGYAATVPVGAIGKVPPLVSKENSTKLLSSR